MTMSSLRWGLVSIGIAAATVTAIAAEPGPPEPPVYQPVMSDLMNMVIQPRHIKLWLAGQGGDWEYADYERHNIGGAMARIATAIPAYKGLPTAALIASFATRQLAGMDAAIKAKDGPAFVAAYAALTTGCNQCHIATGHAFIVMQQPGSGAFPDQAFSPDINGPDHLYQPPLTLTLTRPGLN